MAARAKPGEPKKVKRGAYGTCRQCGGRFKLGYDGRDLVCGACRPISTTDWKSVPTTWQAQHKFLEQQDLIEKNEPKPEPSWMVRDGTNRWGRDRYEPPEEYRRSTRVLLDADDLLWAYAVAVERNTRNIADGRAERHGAKGNRLDYHFTGCLGELVLARWVGLPWTASTQYQRWASDVGPLEARSTDHPNGRLVLHDTDKPDAPYMLLIANRLTEWWVVGWILGRDGCRQEYREDPTGEGRWAYFVPRTMLRPPDEILAHLEAVRDR